MKYEMKIMKQNWILRFAGNDPNGFCDPCFTKYYTLSVDVDRHPNEGVPHGLFWWKIC